MKKALLLIALLAATLSLSTLNASAQDRYFISGDIKVDAYVGFNHPLVHGLYGYYTIIPFGAAAEYGIVDFGDGDYGTVGAGAGLDMNLNHYADAFKFGIQVSTYADYHYFIAEPFEIFVKQGLAFKSFSYPYNHLSYHGMLGFSFYLNSPFAITAEFGYSFGARGQIGVSMIF